MLARRITTLLQALRWECVLRAAPRGILPISALTDRQPFAVVRQQYRHDREDEANAYRDEPVHIRTPRPTAHGDAHNGPDEAEERAGFFQEHHEHGRILSWHG